PSPQGPRVRISRAKIGISAVAIFLAAYPLKNRAGIYMFIGVALFGVGTIILGVSTNTEVSIAALALMGAADMVSVY
ncbi:MFS transporter, partial [Rhizobium ruizarguesonis]